MRHRLGKGANRKIILYLHSLTVVINNGGGGGALHSGREFSLGTGNAGILVGYDNFRKRRLAEQKVVHERIHPSTPFIAPICGRHREKENISSPRYRILMESIEQGLNSSNYCIIYTFHNYISEGILVQSLGAPQYKDVNDATNTYH